MAIAYDRIRDIVRRSDELQKQLKIQLNEPKGIKTLRRRWSVSEAAKLVERTRQGIREAEDRGKLPTPQRDPKTRRHAGYSLAEINAMYDVFNTRPTRSRAEDPLCVLPVQNFKGGVSKSVTAVHIAEYLSLRGLKVLAIDCDSQASLTRLLSGYNPDEDLDEGDTLKPFLFGEQKTIRYAIRDTHWPGLKLIPSNLSLYGAEYGLASSMSKSGTSGRGWLSLRRGVESVGDDFDCVIIDPPPALGMISLNVMYAANAMLIPMPPNMLDFYSTAQFFQMLEEVMGTLGARDEISRNLEYSFVKILISRKKQRSVGEDRPQDVIVNLAKSMFGDYLMESVMYESEEVEAAIGANRTIYEMEEPMTSHNTYSRAINTFDSIGSEVLRMIRRSWPSHVRKAEHEGKTI